ncbi:MAG: hypothetical protein P4M08_02535 [Oligoflexia bacterium]|nr:hypothetical protein [Oligoflexia bacterium]
MSYYIRSLPLKKKHPKWKVQFVSYKKEDTRGSKAKLPKREWDVPRERWRALGFVTRMTYEEARARSKQLNSLELIKRQEKRLRLLRLEERELGQKYQAFLPEEFKAEFELRYLRSRDSQTERRLRRFTRAHILWRAVQKLIIHVKVEPSEWFCNHYQIYDYFFEKKLSLSYTNKMIAMMNLWGFLICKKIDEPFLPVPRPRGYERQRLVDNYYQGREGRKGASRPLSPETLNQAKGKMPTRQFSWLFISVWLGLRPQEIDNLKDPNLWRIEVLPTGTKILWIFQTKLVALPPSDRWKPIPLLYDEQKFAIRMIESKALKRPLVKTVKKHCGSGISLYGGRKGFTDLMLAKGHSLESISQWMGHTTITRTWRTYKDRRGVLFSI